LFDLTEGLPQTLAHPGSTALTLQIILGVHHALALLLFYFLHKVSHAGVLRLAAQLNRI